MAQYTITHSCGHAATHRLFGKHTERERTLAYRAKDVCPDCYKAQQADKVAQASVDLPELTGSEKQIAWAQKIRVQLIKACDDFAEQTIKTVKPGMEDTAKARFAKVRGHMLSKTSAAWWIDNRDQAPVLLVPALYKEISK